MESDKYIEITSLCISQNVSEQFLITLKEFELIQIIEKNNVKFIDLEQLDTFEKFIRLHNELEINAEGIDVIHNLMKRIQSMEFEIHHLKQQLNLYQSEDF